MRKALGSAIRARRDAAGLTQAQLAERLEVHKQTIVKYEAGAIDIPAGRLDRIADALGVRPHDLTMEADAISRGLYGAGEQAVVARTVREPAPTYTPLQIPQDVRKRLDLMANDFEREMIEADADEPFKRHARGRLRDPSLFEMYAGGHDSRPMTPAEQIDDYAEVIEDLRRTLKKRQRRLNAQSGKLADE